jgi:hypothetical protein
MSSNQLEQKINIKYLGRWTAAGGSTKMIEEIIGRGDI